MIEWDKYTRYNEKGRKLRFFKRYPEKLQELYALKEEGKSNIEIARMWGLHHSTIRSQWIKYIGLGKSAGAMTLECGIVVKVEITKKDTCLVVDDDGPRNQGHTYKEYLQIEEERRLKRLSQQQKT